MEIIEAFVKQVMHDADFDCLEESKLRGWIDELLNSKNKEFETILETMPTSTSSKLKIGENEYALKQLRKTQPELTIRDLEEHNIEAKGHDDGYKKAVGSYTKWRNEAYLKFKKLS